mmetsp:Transcript_10746/g.44700  ORF Transcript_10746/g.44700 Transcript_10746/m.44700 type:complete len:222 (+) Transcript_10746:285-950(+)
MSAQEHLRRRGLQAGRTGRRAPRHDLPRGEGVLLEARHLARARARARIPGAGARGPRQPRLHVETALRVAQARPVAPRRSRQSHRRRGPREGPHVRSRGGRRTRSRGARGVVAAAARAQPARLVAGRVDARRRAGERRGMQARALRADRVPSTESALESVRRRSSPDRSSSSAGGPAEPSGNRARPGRRVRLRGRRDGGRGLHRGGGARARDERLRVRVRV